ncbi:hypothetical protein [Paenibacillus physcomitrellae]|uniref:Uncharacterized protein n=1 Tax=Paenibacillus physcomitrellae TaxID=1619311 RepID=A0ABQ1GDU3_9BACL|nr:hypothetical protein [Paenibacillus physcomitrellae]GGA41729.1 hypothetical protein GCM10010917_28760 [Paenibacillus physcomitrellae]
MIDVKKIVERIQLRRTILEQLYEIFYSGGPEAFSGKTEALVGTKEELYTDNERHKAFHYLLGKKYINISSSGGTLERLAVFITSDGIVM